jgi:3-isopropylmalate/(R)-2-methylmalate dehydratase small subunit
LAIERITSITGTALPLRGDNIDTDRIIPARFLRSTSFEGLEEHLLEDDRQQAGATHPFSNPAYSAATIMFVQSNFGCGSSREHAPQAIRRRGIRAIVGVSFSEIFFGNSVALGLPCASVSAEQSLQLIEAAERDSASVFELDLDALRILGAGLSLPVTLPAGARDSFLRGTWDATALLLDNYEEVEAVAAKLPYMRG